MSADAFHNRISCVIMSKSGYEGLYRIKAAPRNLKTHNAVSWREVERVIAASGGVAEFDALASAVVNHRHGTKTAAHPYQFVTIASEGDGWFVPTTSDMEKRFLVVLRGPSAVLVRPEQEVNVVASAKNYGQLSITFKTR